MFHMSEFEIIERFFKKAYPSSKGDLSLGIGDDAAIINVPEDSELVMSMDTLLAGVHFFEGTSAENIAFKSPGGGLPPYRVNELLNKKLNKDLLEDDLIYLDSLM